MAKHLGIKVFVTAGLFIEEMILYQLFFVMSSNSVKIL
jgi:hypothetical protein